MRAGSLDRTITVERYTTGAPDDYGAPGESWVKVAELRAQVIQLSTEEFIRNGAVDETVMFFRTRYIEGVRTSDRISFAGNYFNIKEVKEIGRRRGLEIRSVMIGDA